MKQLKDKISYSTQLDMIQAQTQIELGKPSTKRTAYNFGKILIVDDEKFNCDIIDGFLMVLNF